MRRRVTLRQPRPRSRKPRPKLRQVWVKGDDEGLARAAQEALGFHVETPDYDTAAAWGLAWAWEHALAQLDNPLLLEISISIGGDPP